MFLFLFFSIQIYTILRLTLKKSSSYVIYLFIFFLCVSPDVIVIEIVYEISFDSLPFSFRTIFTYPVSPSERCKPFHFSLSLDARYAHNLRHCFAAPIAFSLHLHIYLCVYIYIYIFIFKRIYNMSKIVTSMIHYRLCLHRRDLKIYGIFLCCVCIYKDVKKNLFGKKNKKTTYRYRV